MNSFTKKLVLTYTGIIFIGFLVVYVLFNVMVRAYIRSETEREFTTAREIGESGEFTREDVRIRAFPNEAMEDWHFQPTEMTIMEVDGSILSFYVAQPGHRVRIAHSQVTDDTQVYLSMSAPRRSFINTDVIIIGSLNEIVMPRLHDLNEAKQNEVKYVADYFVTNPERFTEGSMVMLTDEVGGTFYLRSLVDRQSIGRSILLYSDVSQVMDFVTRMNRMLGALLIVSGIAGVITSLIISARFKNAIGRLCHYADTIGQGNFYENPGVFKDLEFVRLSTSMNDMSNMLKLYEDDQKKFFQNASHEMRTPLMSIKGYAEGILQGVFCKDEAAQIILQEGQKMTELVSSLLYLSRQNEMPEIISLVDIKNLAYNCRERVLPIAKNRDITISISSPEGIIIETDEERLERAVINILANAIRHAKKEVHINCTHENGELKIEIKDDGDGIKPSELPHIFKRFYKGENGNIGLGLAISQEIVRGLGGGISVRNEGGAVFLVVVPC
ncbi:MAG: HAMP domain-containing histidine kinase [Defluviitaleaceae bacterium]|nr:HAMP domain-containing histidine kinase [Defluviitaleaceae bacterium]